MKETGALEPRPGVEPTAAWMSEILAQQQRRAGEDGAFARRIKAIARRNGSPSARRIPAVALPFTVGGTDAAARLTSLFDDTIARLLEAAQ